MQTLVALVSAADVAGCCPISLALQQLQSTVAQQRMLNILPRRHDGATFELQFSDHQRPVIYSQGSLNSNCTLRDCIDNAADAALTLMITAVTHTTRHSKLACTKTK
jgi:hypothetical protein